MLIHIGSKVNMFASKICCEALECSGSRLKWIEKCNVCVCTKVEQEKTITERVIFMFVKRTINNVDDYFELKKLIKLQRVNETTNTHTHSKKHAYFFYGGNEYVEIPFL